MADVDRRQPHRRGDRRRGRAPLAVDASHDILRTSRRALESIFAPKRVAVVGASERPGSVGRTVLWNLVSNPFGGTVYPVNPKRESVLGVRAYRSVGDLPEPVDLAVVVTPAPRVPDVIRECVEIGVPGAIVISAGFKEAGPEGAALEEATLREARRGGMRIIGPNCLGVMRPVTGLNATFAGGMALPGKVGFISQSGALLTAILDWSLRERLGFSAFVSIGSMLDVGWGDLIHYLGDDPHTSSIVLYMETIGDARSFLSAAREVARQKPVIVIKAGRTVEAAQAAVSHTGSLAGSDEVLDAAFRRTGVLRVDSIAHLFSMADVLGKQPTPRGRRLTILTNAGGPGVLATDTLVRGGGELATLSDETRRELDRVLPPHWSHGNPIDVLGDAAPERYAQALAIAEADEHSDGLLVILTPQDMTDPTRTAEHLAPLTRAHGKPVLASWMGGASIAAGEEILNRAGIPTFPYPDAAAQVFNYLWQFSHNLNALYETPVPRGAAEGAHGRGRATEIVTKARAGGRTILNELESKQILDAYGIPTVETRFAPDAEAAVEHAESLGYPVVVKLHSDRITHKTDVGGVKLGITDAAGVRAAFESIRAAVAERAEPSAFGGVTVQPMVPLEGYELIVGSTTDAQFGPVLLFGAGGSLVEVYADRALGLPPLNTTLARRMMEQTKIHAALRGVRGRRPVDLPALEELLVQFSQLVVEQRLIAEIDLNPLLATDERLIALDARVVLHPAEVSEEDLPPLAIRPYPQQYVGGWTLRDGTAVTIRPIRPEDEPAMRRFHATLSEHSVYLRYGNIMNLSVRTQHERLSRICFTDYDREMVLVAEREPVDHERELVGVARLNRVYGTCDAEFAVLVADQHQSKGLGTELLRRLVEIGAREGLERIVGFVLPFNAPMLRTCRKLGFETRTVDEGIEAVKEIAPPSGLTAPECR